MGSGQRFQGCGEMGNIKIVRKMKFEDFEKFILSHGFSIVCLNHYFLNQEKYTFCVILNPTTNKAFKSEGKDSNEIFDELYCKMLEN